MKDVRCKKLNSLKLSNTVHVPN